MHLAAMVMASSLAGSPECDLQHEIDALSADLRAFERTRSQGALDAERAVEIRAIVKDALADAGTRMLMQGGPDEPAFEGDNFYRLDASGTEISSADGNFRYHLNVQMQLRFIWNHREELGDTQG
jgi:hypothetical protein